MVSGTPIISIGAEGESPAAAPQGDSQGWSGAGPMPRLDELGYRETDETPADFAEIGGATDWVLPALAGLAVAGWTALFLWAQRDAIAQGPTPAEWMAWLGQWSGPVLVIGLAWLLAMRNSRREGRRFADTARMLATEAAALDARLVAANRELSLAREFMAAQARDLDALGRTAADRLHQQAERLTALVGQNAAEVSALGAISETALQNMEALRAQLPVVANATRDVTNHIGAAGRSAQTQMQELLGALARLNETGAASETQMSGLRERAEAMMDLLESRTQQLAAAMTGRFEALEARSHGFAIDLEKHEADARDALRQRAATLNEEVSATRARLDREEAESLVSLRARLSALRDEAGSLSRALRDGEATAMADWQAAVQRMAEDVARMDGDIAAHHHARLEQTARLGALTEASLARLIQAEARIEAIALADQQLAGSMDTRLDTIERRLAETDRSVEKLTEGSARLLDLIQSSERQSRERLPRALDASEKRLAEYNAQVEKLHDFVASTHANGKGLAESLSTAHGTLLHASAEIEAMHNALGEKLNAQNGAITAMREHLAQVGTDTDEIATRARGELEASLARLAAAMQASVRGIEAQGAARIEALADRLGEEGGAAIAAAMDRQIQHISPRIEQAASHAAAISQQATEQLQAQISAVNDLAGHLEARVDAARTRAEEQVDNDFARRAAIITDALKSAAIDITRALGEEVTDTAWAAYLRGDRGVFSRKAIRLLETGEAREVQHLYEGDPRLRDAVNHYIHDFEAMLRQLLSTRDGHALGVTLLSSDLGKLYVALAQALDRLRS